MKPISDYMVRDMVFVSPDQTLQDAIELMRKHHIGAVLVTKDEDVTGIFTERDLLIKVEINGLPQAGDLKVADFMTRDLVTVQQDDAHTKVIDLMREKRIRHVPVLDAHGKPVGIVSLRDVLSQYNDHLLTALMERSKVEDQLRRTYNQLQRAQDHLIQAEKMKVVGNLAAGIAHEVKNPLTIVMLGLETLKMIIPEKNEEYVSVMKDIVSAVERANSVVLELLDFSRTSELNFKPGNINKTVNVSLDLVKHHLEKNKIRIQKKMDPDLPDVRMDSNKMEQVFINVLMNAIQAMQGTKDGRITVTTAVKKAKEKEQGVGRRRSDPFAPGDKLIVIHVENSGEKIPESLLKNIFEPFVTTKEGVGGTGLGLAIIKHIVDMHQGIIGISNRPQGGVCVEVILKG